MTTDPVLLATVTTGLSTLGLKAVDGVLTEAAKDLWSIVKKRLGWTADPSPDNLATGIAARLKDDSNLANELAELLKCHPQAGIASALVGNIQGGTVVVAGTLNVSGDFKM
jgi:hypothetical protein